MPGLDENPYQEYYWINNITGTGLGIVCPNIHPRHREGQRCMAPDTLQGSCLGAIDGRVQLEILHQSTQRGNIINIPIQQWTGDVLNEAIYRIMLFLPQVYYQYHTVMLKCTRILNPILEISSNSILDFRCINCLLETKVDNEVGMCITEFAAKSVTQEHWLSLAVLKSDTLTRRSLIYYCVPRLR